MNYSYLKEMYKIPHSIVKKIRNENELIKIIQGNFTSGYAKNFINYSNLSLNVWSKVLPISKRTLQRELEDKNKILEIVVSETLVEMGEIYAIGLKAFDDDKKRLTTWFSTQNPYFNNKKPIDIMDTHKGRDLVKAELYRIEHSEFS